MIRFFLILFPLLNRPYCIVYLNDFLFSFILWHEYNKARVIKVSQGISRHKMYFMQMDRGGSGFLYSVLLPPDT